MSFTITSPVTGAAQTGLTTPTYTLAVDTAPTSAGKQYAVTAIGGTQTGVDASSSAARPFTITGSRPPVLRQLSAVDPITGQLRNVPVNTYNLLVRKGVTPLSGQPASLMQIRVQISIPAGAEVADAPNVRAALSLMFGAIAQISSSVGDTVITGVI